MMSKEVIEEIKKLYLDGYSSPEIREIIFDKYGISRCNESIRKYLVRSGTTIRDPKRAIILYHRRKEPVSDIIKLYKKGRAIRELARQFGIERETIRKILKENCIKIKDSRSALISIGRIKEKEKFDLDPKEKAYLFGLVMGDLTPVKKSGYTIKLITHTTHLTFVDLLCKIFKKYGVTSYKETKNKGMFRFNAYIDLESFSFLLNLKEETIPYWINYDNFFSFLAGFIDSDGSVIVRKAGNYFQFVIRFFGQNLNLLLDIKKRLEDLGYDISIHKNHSKGDTSYHNGIKFRYNKDYYVLETYKKDQTLDLLNKIPIRHPEKLAKRELIFKISKQNVLQWDKIKVEVNELRSLIKQSVLSKSRLVV